MAEGVKPALVVPVIQGCEMISFVLADDERLFRHALRGLLEAEEGFSVVGEATTGTQAVSYVEERRPSILLLDMRLPLLHGIDVLQRLHVLGLDRDTRVVVVSQYEDSRFVREAFEAGAWGFVSKMVPATELVSCVRSVLDGHTKVCVSPQGPGVMGPPARGTGQVALDVLTDREREVFEEVARFMTAKAIAKKLGISPRTVEIHRRNALKKLHLESKLDLYRYALWRGMLEGMVS